MIPLGPGNEFDAIRDMIRRWGSNARDIGDDGALLHVPADHQLVVSTDSSIENRHFGRGWLTPREIGYRATTAALSDLAAMAARPIGILVALAVPQSWRERVGELAEGIGEAAGAFAAPIVGGDTSAATELNITITVLGVSQNPLGRRGARVGDAVYITGDIGGSISALRVFQRGGKPSSEHFEQFARPSPRIREAQWLVANGATSAIDISDGALSDIAHLAYAGGVRIHVEVDSLPVVEGVDPRHAAQSGEEYELALTGPDSIDRDAFRREFGVALTRVGSVVEGEPGVHSTFQGAPLILAAGHDHFLT